MRLRIAIAVLLTVTVYATAACFWRQVFPFRDGLAKFLPSETIAYVHVNLTPNIRRQVAFQISNVHLPMGESLAGVLTEALRSPEVRELGLIWTTPRSADTSPFTFLIGQRPSRRADVVAPTTLRIGDATVDVRVGRLAEDGDVASRLPLQIALHPRELPFPALDAARAFLPESFAASGTIDARGIVLRSDHRMPFALLPARVPLLAPPSPDAVHVLRIPVASLLPFIRTPFHGDLRRAVTAVVPATMDLLWTPQRGAIRLPGLRFSDPVVAEIIRALAARWQPEFRSRLLDGLAARVAVADPASLHIDPLGSHRWAISRDAQEIVSVVEANEHLLLATDPGVLDAMLGAPSAQLRLPRRCVPEGADAFTVVSLLSYPQFVIVLAVDRGGDPYIICGGAFPID